MVDAMKVKFIFGNCGELDLFSTNILKTTVQDINQALTNEKNTVISYTLNDLPLTYKFIEYWSHYRKLNFEFHGGENVVYHYNFYLPITRESLLSAKTEMNNTIQELKTFDYTFDNSLLLDTELIETLTASETQKLNQLHLFFERETMLLTNTVPNSSRISYLLEKVNNLVHFIETTNSINNQQDKQFNVVARPFYPPGPHGYYKLTDDDYKDFTFPVGGDLIADFSTVGKDLFACFTSNDTELIKNGGVMQQEYLTDFLSLHFNQHTKTNDNNIKNQYYNWCEKNSVSDYIDFKLPKFNANRHVLGSIDQPIYTSNDFYEHIFKNTPSFLGYVLCNDNGDIIK
jgi:hypothetical protein